eukprot:1820107-Prymnesium_polylepis.2
MLRVMNSCVSVGSKGKTAVRQPPVSSAMLCPMRSLPSGPRLSFSRGPEKSTRALPPTEAYQLPDDVPCPPPISPYASCTSSIRSCAVAAPSSSPTKRSGCRSIMSLRCAFFTSPGLASAATPSTSAALARRSDLQRVARTHTRGSYGTHRTGATHGGLPAWRACVAGRERAQKAHACTAALPYRTPSRTDAAARQYVTHASHAAPPRAGTAPRTQRRRAAPAEEPVVHMRLEGVEVLVGVFDRRTVELPHASERLARGLEHDLDVAADGARYQRPGLVLHATLDGDDRDRHPVCKLLPRARESAASTAQSEQRARANEAIDCVRAPGCEL